MKKLFFIFAILMFIGCSHNHTQPLAIHPCPVPKTEELLKSRITSCNFFYEKLVTLLVNDYYVNHQDVIESSANRKKYTYYFNVFLKSKDLDLKFKNRCAYEMPSQELQCFSTASTYEIFNNCEPDEAPQDSP